MSAPRSLAPALLVLAVVLAGCAAEEAGTVEPRATEQTPSPTVLTVDACEECFEDSVGALPSGRLAVLNGARLLVLDPATGAKEERSLPEVPPPALPGSRSVGDGLVQVAPNGRLYYSNLVVGPQQRLAGSHVAASDDEGATWTINTFVPPLTTPAGAAPTGIAGTDRQWLAFGADELVYVSWAQQDFVSTGVFGYAVGTGLWVARSADGGRTFDDPVLAVPYEERLTFGQAGAGAVDAEGRVMLPYAAGGCADPFCATDRVEQATMLAVSSDEGRTWTQEKVAGGLSTGFPSLAVVGASRVVAIWDTEALSLTRDDGDGAWTAPEPWTDPSTSGYFGAAILPRADGGLDVVTYEVSDSCSLVVLRGSPEARTVLATDLAGVYGRACPTDFASAARMPDGRIAAVWNDPDAQEILLALV